MSLTSSCKNILKLLGNYETMKKHLIGRKIDILVKIQKNYNYNYHTRIWIPNGSNLNILS